MYLHMLDDIDTVTVTEEMYEVQKYVTTMTVKEALVVANNFNVGKMHPDVAVTIDYLGKGVNQVVKGIEIIGLVSKESNN